MQHERKTRREKNAVNVRGHRHERDSAGPLSSNGRQKKSGRPGARYEQSHAHTTSLECGVPPRGSLKSADKLIYQQHGHDRQSFHGEIIHVRYSPRRQHRHSKHDHNHAENDLCEDEEPPRINQRYRRSEKYSRAIMLIIMIVVFINFIILPSSMTPTPESSLNNWSRRKFSSSESIVTPINEEAEQFFRTGKLSLNSQFSHASRAGRKYKTEQNRLNVGTSMEQSGQRHKKNRLLYGRKSKVGIEGWPPLPELIDADGNIANGVDVSGLLDFAIVGFAKTGTTSLLRHLSDVTDALPAENCGLVVNHTAKLARDIYDDHARRLQHLENGGGSEGRLRGLKCPQDVSSDWSMHNYAKYFPRTKIIVGIRHPVFWFESLYNFRVSNVPWKKMLHTSKLTKGCIGGSQGVCAWRANFHDFLSRLGKTPMSSPSEMRLLQLQLDRVQTPVGPVFLYDVSQLSDSGDGGIRSAQFRTDLRNFLGLTKEIPPFPAVDTSGRFDFLPVVKRQTEEEKIDICEPEHDAIRAVLVEKAKMSSIWIRKYFLSSSEVFVSSRQHLNEILESWMHDPCAEI